MHKLTTAQTLNIITLLDSGLSGVQISHQTGLSTAAISRICSEHCPDLPKSSGGRPSKLTPANISYAAHLIYMGKAANTLQASKSLSNITNASISARTLHRQLKKDGMKPVVKKKKPLLNLIIGRLGGNLQRGTKSGLWRIGRESGSLMRLTSIIWGQMEGNMCGKGKERL